MLVFDDVVLGGPTYFIEFFCFLLQRIKGVLVFQILR